jgi:hypothetical protein
MLQRCPEPALRLPISNVLAAGAYRQIVGLS